MRGTLPHRFPIEGIHGLHAQHLADQRGREALQYGVEALGRLVVAVALDLVVFIENRADDANFVRVCYGGEAEKEHAEKLVRLLKKKADLEDDQIQLVHIGPIIASHTGSTVLAMFFKQKNDRS